MIYTLALLSGILIFTDKALLKITNSEIAILAVLLIFSAFIYKKFNKLAKIIIVAIIGYFWALLFSIFILTTEIEKKYHNQYIQVTGVITSLVDMTDYKNNFIFQTSQPFVAKLKLSIYGKIRPKLSVGEEWQFHIKLKNNNGLSNVGSFDYEKWLFLQRIDATGYVNIGKSYQFIRQTNTHKITKIRQDIRNKLLEVASKNQFIGVINAILIGDKSLIKQQHKTIFIKTGTSHLSVISGLHLSIIASVVFTITLIILSRIPAIINRIPLMIIAAFLTIIAVGCYMFLANFSIPTQRAFIMISAFMLAIIWRNKYSHWQLYASALILTLIINPLSVLAVGFWLSFIAAAIIIYFVHSNHQSHHNINQKIKYLIYLQVVITLVMSPIVLWFFGEFSMLSPIANLIAIPIFSLFIVPLSFLGLLLVLLNIDYLATLVFIIVNGILNYLFELLSFLSSSWLNSFHYQITNKVELTLLMVAIIMLISYKKLNLRLFALIILLALILDTKEANNHLHIMDVAQGSSAVVAIQDKAIIIDTGNKFRSGFNMGDAVIKPFLLAKGIKEITDIIISHNDQDHIGGLKTLLATYQVKNLITPDNNKCHSKNSWQTGEWYFQILTTDHKFKGNNASCVIKISNTKYSILFTGDIEEHAENYLINKYHNLLKSDILIVPHHGSKTSSSLKFLQVVAPKVAIVSAGFQNRYQHPAEEVIKRYQVLGIKLFTTACSGQISIDLNNLTIMQHRLQTAKYYHRLCAKS